MPNREAKLDKWRGVDLQKEQRSKQPTTHHNQRNWEKAYGGGELGKLKREEGRVDKKKRGGVRQKLNLPGTRTQ